jgi:hypothetical protein
MLASVDASRLISGERGAEDDDRRACQYAATIIGLIAARPAVQGILLTPAAAESVQQILRGEEQVSHPMDRHCWDALRRLPRGKNE